MKFFWVIEGDISCYFDTINHRKLMKLLARRIDDGKLKEPDLEIPAGWGDGTKAIQGHEAGYAARRDYQSPPGKMCMLNWISTCAKVRKHLTRKEKRVERNAGMANFAYVRYADDFVILCNGNKEQAVASSGRLLHLSLAHASPNLVNGENESHSLRGYLERTPRKSRDFLAPFSIFERRLSAIRVRSKAANHLLDSRDLDPGLAGGGLILVILTQPPAAPQPGNGPLHYPADLHRHETRRAFGFHDHADRVRDRLRPQPLL